MNTWASSCYFWSIGKNGFLIGFKGDYWGKWIRYDSWEGKLGNQIVGCYSRKRVESIRET